MSRIRVYELAKEAGMSSKALAEKLQAAGYDIKGHSSSVDEETAEEIRRTVLKSADTELVEKRIDSKKNKPTVIRRRATVIRRKAKVAEKSAEEVAKEPAAEDVAAGTPEPAVETAKVTEGNEETGETVAVKNVQSDTAEDDVAESRETVAAVQDEKTDDPEVEKSEELSVTEETENGVATQVETAVEKKDDGTSAVTQQAEELVEKTNERVEKKADSVKKESKNTAKPKGQKAPERKPMARIVRTIELPEEHRPAPSSRPKKKPVRQPSGPRVPNERMAIQADLPRNETSRGRKKGKKASQNDSRDLQRRGGKKGQKNVKFTHFGADYEGQMSGGKRRKKGRKQARVTPPPSEMKASKKRFKVYDTITVGDLAQKMKVKANEVIAKLMGLGVMATINQPVDTDTAILIAADFGYEVEQGMTEELGIQMLNEAEEGGEKKPRPPVVTVMGHVDHGKTSILDAIRKSDVAAGEAGGITQHIGAYLVRSNAGDVTFVDTPGHAAFTEMRSRGAQVTDIVILVVAADDGVMDQTREAINHSQAAGVPIIVAVNKIDKDNADVDRVKRELSELNLMPEDWGGDTIYCETSAKQNIGIDNLMESIQLMAEMLELKADSERKAKGRVIEAQLHKGRGAVATVLVQEGTLHLGDNFVVGQYHGKVRAMLNHKGKPVEAAGPSTPVEVQGLGGVPSAGDEFIVVTDEKMARNVAQKRALKARESELGSKTKISLDKLFEQMNEGEVQELRIVLRSDVQGTLEAFAKAAEDLSTKEIKVRILHEGTGTITESDILLASASDAIIIGFNVRPSVKVKELAGIESVDVRSYDVIYHALDDIKAAMVGMLDPTFEEEVIGLAEVRDTFSVPKVGTIAGCAVVDGKITRRANVRVLRDGVVIYTGKIESLRRFKDDVREVVSGYECGIGVEKFNDIKVGDGLEAFIMNEVEATLE